MHTKGIIFDLYNTLIYSDESRTSPYSQFLGSLGLTKKESSKWIDRILTENFNSLDDIKKIINPKSPINTDIYEFKIQEEIDSTIVFDDTYSTLEILSKKYKLFLLSNVATPYKKCFYNLSLDKYIDNPFFSCDLGYRKPQKELFEIVIKHSGFNPNELIMIGDSLRSDYQGALDCGIPSILKNKSLSLILSDLT